MEDINWENMFCKFDEFEYKHFYNIIEDSLFSCYIHPQFDYLDRYLFEYFSLSEDKAKILIDQKNKLMNLNKSDEEDIRHFIVGTYLFFMSMYINNTSENYKNIDFSNKIYIEFYKYTFYVFKKYVKEYLKAIGIKSLDEIKHYETLNNIFYFIPDDYKNDDKIINDENYYIKKYFQFMESEEYMGLPYGEKFETKEIRYNQLFNFMLVSYGDIECNLRD